MEDLTFSFNITNFVKDTRKRNARGKELQNLCKIVNTFLKFTIVLSKVFLFGNYYPNS